MAGQGATRPGRRDETPDRWQMCRMLDKMIDDMRANGNTRVEIYMRRKERGELQREIQASTLVIAAQAPTDQFGAVIETYHDCRIHLLDDDADPGVYVVGWN